MLLYISKSRWFGLLISLSILIYVWILCNAPLKGQINDASNSQANGEFIKSLNILLEPCSCSRTINTNWNTSDIALLPNSSCGRWATLRGLGQNVISYSLYGEFPTDYHRGLEHLVPDVKRLYPGWIMRVYHDEDFWHSKNQTQWACSLACNNPHLDFCDISNIPDFGNLSTVRKTVKRFIVVGDSTVNRYLVRDLDSPILQREVDAVNEWIDSGKGYHVMRDHAYHGVSMLAGMWGGCNSYQLSSSLPLTDLRRQMLQYGTTMGDQPTLWKAMWPQIKDNVMAHDSFTCNGFKGSKPFPTKRDGENFVGMQGYKTNYKLKGIKLKGTCPIICRPKDHQDWELC